MTFVINVYNDKKFCTVRQFLKGRSNIEKIKVIFKRIYPSKKMANNVNCHALNNTNLYNRALNDTNLYYYKFLLFKTR